MWLWIVFGMGLAVAWSYLVVRSFVRAIQKMGEPGFIVRTRKQPYRYVVWTGEDYTLGDAHKVAWFTRDLVDTIVREMGGNQTLEVQSVDELMPPCREPVHAGELMLEGT